MSFEVKDGILKIKDINGITRFSTGDALVFKRTVAYGSGAIGGATSTLDKTFTLYNSVFVGTRDMMLPRFRITSSNGNLIQGLVGHWFTPNTPIPVHIEYSPEGYIKNIELLTVSAYPPTLRNFVVSLYNHANGFANNSISYVNFEFMVDILSYRNS